MVKLALLNTEIYHQYKLISECTVSGNSETTYYLSIC